MSKISTIEGKSIYYLAPDYDIPSWGNAILYAHVRLLNKNGINAKILHHKSPFRYSWFQSDVPICYLNDREFKIAKDDYLVVPEVNILDDEPQRLRCNKIVFVQGGFLILLKMQKAQDFSALGYDHVIVTMPNIKKIVDTHFGAKAHIIPAYIAPYFFANKEDLKKERSKTVLLFPKDVYRQLGQLDYDILKKILDRKFADNVKKLFGFIKNQDKSKWHVVELKSKKHQEVASIMKESSFFVCVNTVEGFNVAVPEAMAAGCIPICYDAYGGTDYLENDVNAYVFKNNYIYPLLEKLFYLIDNYENIQDELSQIRQNAYETALNYTEEQMERSLLEFYTELIK